MKFHVKYRRVKLTQLPQYWRQFPIGHIDKGRYLEAIDLFKLVAKTNKEIEPDWAVDSVRLENGIVVYERLENGLAVYDSTEIFPATAAIDAQFPTAEEFALGVK